jgi:PadR family transcriptional regulator, regulatory protein AphA
MSLSHALLGLLFARPASGYDLMKSFDTSLAGVWSATRSQVCGELIRLTESGLIEVAAVGPRGRKEYAPTEAGLAKLRAWITDPRPEPAHRSEALLRVFFLDAVSPEHGHDYQLQQAEQATARHAGFGALRDSLDRQQGQNSTNADTNARLVLEDGLRLTTVVEEWAQWADRQVQSRAVAEAC